MIFFTNLGSWETYSDEEGEEHLHGEITVCHGAPVGIENPDFPAHLMRYDVVMVLTDTPKKLRGRTAMWDNHAWRITHVTRYIPSHSSKINAKAPPNGGQLKLTLKRLPADQTCD